MKDIKNKIKQKKGITKEQIYDVIGIGIVIVIISIVIMAISLKNREIGKKVYDDTETIQSEIEDKTDGGLSREYTDEELESMY